MIHTDNEFVDIHSGHANGRLMDEFYNLIFSQPSNPDFQKFRTKYQRR